MYKPLIQNKRTIRLLNLLPGSGEISCRLTECPLEDAKGRYKAVSYTWKGGTETAQQFIHCDDFRKVPVTPNLYAALRRLRDATDVVVLWVDGLCIDQNNTEERTHQVGMMRDIYTNSTEVIIWLGCEGETYDSEQPIIEFWGDERDIQHIGSHLNRMYSQRKDKLSMALSTDMYGTFCMISLLAQGLKASNIWYLRRLDYAPAIIQGLVSLLEMPWWSRIWVVQETVVASQAIVYWNNISMPWDVFSGASSRISKHSVELLGLSAAKTYGPTLSSFCRKIGEIEGTRKSWSAVEPSSLLPLLRKFRNRGASDKRDKVFALLGLVKYWGGSEPLVPNYDHRLSVVYLETAKHLIRSYRSLAALSGTTASPKDILSGFPSWLTDWRHIAPEGEADRLSAQHMYEASGVAVDGIKLHGSTLLEVGGARIDRVALTVGRDGRPEQKSRSIVSSWWNRLPWPAYACYETGPGTVAVKDAFWRTICADLIFMPSAVSEKGKFRRAKPADAVSFKRWYTGGNAVDEYRRTSIVDGMFIEGVSEEEMEAEQRSSAFNRSVECASRGRSFFITEGGRMGLGPDACKKGDEVYLLSGSRVPMILRPSARTKKCGDKRIERLVLSAEEESTRIAAGQPGAARTFKDHELAKEMRCGEEHPNCFTLVGDAYVHGIMDGRLASASLKGTSPVFLV